MTGSEPYVPALQASMPAEYILIQSLAAVSVLATHIDVVYIAEL